jgi:hypothetical protein
MNDGLGRMGKDVVMTCYLRTDYCRNICLEELGKTTIVRNANHSVAAASEFY